MKQNYEELVERIAKSTSLSVEDIQRRVEGKRAKLSGLISKEGAAQVVAAELGVSFDKEKMKISELLPGMKRVNVLGKITRMFPVREYNRNNRQGKIGSFILADDKSNIRVVLWDSNHIGLLEKGQIKESDVVEISNASMRDAELHLTGFSDIKISSEILENVKMERVFHEKRIFEIRQGENARIRAVIIQMFEPRFFIICPACSKGIGDFGECKEHGKVAGEKRYLINLVLDDGTETIRAVLFSEQADKLLGSAGSGDEIGNIEVFVKKRDELLGREIFFSGQIRQNRVFENLELYVEDIEEVDVDKLIEELEKG